MSRAVTLAAVAFDFDGTLVRSNAIKRDCFYEAVAHLPGAGAVLDELFAGGFRGDRHAVFAELVGRLDAAGVPDLPDPAGLVAEYGRAAHARIAAAPDIPGARDALERLQAAGMRLFLVSATPQRPLEAVVAARGLTRCFDDVLGAPPGKPDHLRRIMDAAGIGATDVVMVGDGRDDQEAARVVGCRFIAVTAEPKEPLRGAETAVSDLYDLPRLLGVEQAPPALRAEAPR